MKSLAFCDPGLKNLLTMESGIGPRNPGTFSRIGHQQSICAATQSVASNAGKIANHLTRRLRRILTITQAASFLGLSALFIATLGASPSEARMKTDQVRIVFGTPKNPAEIKLRDDLKAAQVFEKMRKILSPLRLPRRLTLKLMSCKTDHDAWYEDGVVTVCYDYLAFIVDNAARAPKTLAISAKAAWIGATFDLVLHEVSHAVFDLLKIPIFGREEDAADMFSAYIMLQFTPDDAHKLVAGTAFLSATEARKWREERLKEKPLDEAQREMLRRKAFANEHSLPQQRYFNLLCIAYGADPRKFPHATTRGGLPQERAQGCKDEYKQIKYAFEKLIRPHTDQRLAKKIRAKHWFEF